MMLTIALRTDALSCLDDQETTMSIPTRVDYQTEPSRYRHWKLRFEGPIATLACDIDENAGIAPGDKIILVDDRSSAVSLPEVPLLGVLPGTGGLTRVTDKRKVRHDLADIFCTTTEGVRGQKALAWRLVDDIAKPAQFAARVQERALKLAARSDRPSGAQAARGIALTPLERTADEPGLHYATLDGA